MAETTLLCVPVSLIRFSVTGHRGWLHVLQFVSAGAPLWNLPARTSGKQTPIGGRGGSNLAGVEDLSPIS